MTDYVALAAQLREIAQEIETGPEQDAQQEREEQAQDDAMRAEALRLLALTTMIMFRNEWGTREEVVILMSVQSDGDHGEMDCERMLGALFMGRQTVALPGGLLLVESSAAPRRYMMIEEPRGE